ncbi:hypothetical protein Cgig2_017386 [Carnegiea gigantea]|uniref:Uncharacterized protein n=1 Tax=Carnegiea gigantea TaxID=171969 RepID=A0A9Q1GPL0_9CARY|nr:hypothetical protein Cgig2_017386 [Carnegiea gigantea]
MDRPRRGPAGMGTEHPARAPFRFSALRLSISVCAGKKKPGKARPPWIPSTKLGVHRPAGLSGRFPVLQPPKSGQMRKPGSLRTSSTPKAMFQQDLHCFLLCCRSAHYHYCCVGPTLDPKFSFVKVAAPYAQSEKAAQKGTILHMATMYSVMFSTFLNLGITLTSQGSQIVANSSFLGAGVFFTLLVRSIQRVRKLDKFEKMI